jgi:hypothetical protein
MSSTTKFKPQIQQQTYKKLERELDLKSLEQLYEQIQETKPSRLRNKKEKK